MDLSIHSGSPTQLPGYLYYLEGLLVREDFPEELMKGVIECGVEQHRENAEAERADRRRGKRAHTTKSGRKNKTREA